MKRINIKDIVKEEFYQLPKAFFWKKEYREGLSNDAKLLYMIIRDRFNLSIYKTQGQIDAGIENPSYVNEKGDIYCILDNHEIEFTLDVSHRSVLKYIKELIDFDLIEKEATVGGANRLYLKELDTTDVTLQRFLGEKAYYKHVQSRKRKKLEPIKTLEECIAEYENVQKEKQQPVDKSVDKNTGNQAPQDSSEGEGAKSNPLDGAESNHRGVQNVSPEGMQKVAPNNNYSKELELNDTYSNEFDSKDNKSNVNSSSKTLDTPITKGTKELEEEAQITTATIISSKNNYALLKQIEPVSGMSINDICITQKDWNVVYKTLRDNHVEEFSVLVVVKALVLYSKEVEIARANGEQIKYPPAYFGNCLADEARRYADRQKDSAQEKSKHQGLFNHAQVKSGVPFYNWLEEREG